ncbi:hypothetical protein QBC44DRAFT_327284 [Cladorrhinum sp. PSN332]|nr:hypothetical protein QBC44DRAFT_327284 [Cladorrhinum sp. PSN332]
MEPNARQCNTLATSRLDATQGSCMYPPNGWHHSNCYSDRPPIALVSDISLSIRTYPLPIFQKIGDDEDSDFAHEADDADLDADHQFAEDVKPLVEEAYGEFTSHACTGPSSSSKRSYPEQNRPQKRRKCSDHDESRTQLQDVLGFEHRDDNWVSSNLHLNKHATFDCPFHKYSPKKYRRLCLLSRFPTIRSVISHIEAVHCRAPYCPICHSEFKRPRGDAKRRKHIRARQCKPREGSIEIEGLQGDRMDRLCELEPSGTDKEQWTQIWNIAYPELKPPSTPYLDTRDDPYVKLVQAARDFWDQNGKSLVMARLQKTGKGKSASGRCENWTRDVESLQRAVIKGLLGRLLNEDRA